MTKDEEQRDPASHFARLSFDWGSGMPANEGDYVHGSVAISCADIGSYGRVFDSVFQKSVAQLQERNILRRDGHKFQTHHDWTRSSYLVHGNIANPGYSSSFIGVEVHAYGVVSVYFREYTKAATLDELVGWWIYSAWWMGLEVHALLGTSGPAYAAVLVDLAGISDRSVPPMGRSLVKSTHGPFPLESGDGQDAKFYWNKRAAETLASVRADILEESIGTRLPGNADEDSAWTPWDAWKRLAGGRSTGFPGKSRWWQGRRTGRRG
jgi:hypothetical protein